MKDFYINSRVKQFAKKDCSYIKEQLNIEEFGLNKKQVEKNRSEYGSNNIIGKKDNLLRRFVRAFVNPFSVVLLLLALISLFTDIVFTSPLKRNYVPVVIIFVMLLISGFIRFIEEMKSKNITDELTKLVNTFTYVYRDNEWTQIESEEIVVGDLIKLKAGDRVPADIRIITCADCFVSQSIITGESQIIEKSPDIITSELNNISDYKNTAFMGTTIISGTLIGVVTAVGKETVYGDFGSISTKKNGFDKGANSIAWVLIKFMTILVPVVFIASGITKGDWLAAFLFSLSVAVGLTPELLPMVITACLAKGSSSMGKKQTVVKNINAMQGFGSMDTLCVDKTGTLTGDTLVLEYYTDILGNEFRECLEKAYINSYYSTSIANQLDVSILQYPNLIREKSYFLELVTELDKLDEIPFDYSRKISSVLVKSNNKNYLYAKGDIEQIAKRCKYIKYKNKISDIGPDAEKNIHEIVDEMLDCGMKVLAVAEKEVQKDEITLSDEKDLTLIGYIAFFDAPKHSAQSAIEKLSKLNVNIKVLTGDNIKVAESICKRLNIQVQNVLTGEEFDKLNEDELHFYVEKTTLFAELTPKQKAKIVKLLKINGHTVGFLGDGVNDLPAVVEADVGISVDTAAPSVKEIADVILLKKDLNVLEEGIIEGRKSFANMSKYIKITASSNLGNIIAIVLASMILPFFPMTSIQLLLLNLLYDILCLVLPWDNVDTEMIEKPLEWSGNKLSRFMLSFGPISSLFDIITFAFMFFYVCPLVAGGAFETLDIEGQTRFISVFQTGWFLESMWTQILIIQLLRSKKLPLLQSKPSKSVLIVTVCGIVLFTILSMTSLGEFIGLCDLPWIYFVFLICIVICYLLFVTIAKKIYVKKYKRLI